MWILCKIFHDVEESDDFEDEGLHEEESHDSEDERPHKEESDPSVESDSHHPPILEMPDVDHTIHWHGNN